jgi:uncharacterized protein YaaQ
MKNLGFKFVNDIYSNELDMKLFDKQYFETHLAKVRFIGVWLKK